LPDSSFLRL
uniref:Extended FMRFamide-3 n=1 Tax=Lobatophasma redelinghuysense TaxID=253128 RepID=FAR3_LOBRE|nr:RecName: Full=Extended FMRFamide-3; Short=FMRFa-3 [Lobatophasma redelinghuysense]